MPKKKKIIIIVVAVVLLFVATGVLLAFGFYQSMRGEELDKKNLSVNSNLSRDVYNIALFGTDGRNGSTEGRSDSTMIASINTKTGAVKIVSVQRDLMVKIPETEDKDVSYEKFTHAYMYGGKELAVRTLNENFDLNITDYVAVNFEGLAAVVNAVGGVDINIANESVLYATNDIIHSNDMPANDSSLLSSVGMNHMDGYQALAYSRNRYTDSDYGRTERQREVVSAIIKKATDMGLTSAVSAATQAFGYVQTSLGMSEAIELMTSYFNAQSRSLVMGRLPYDGIRSGGMIDGLSYVLATTLEDNVKVLHCELYGDVNYTPSENVRNISNTVAGICGMGSSVDWSVTTPQNIINSQNTTDQ